jgi:6-phosphogluconolactonase (cycloisomerase 2 family)
MLAAGGTLAVSGLVLAAPVVASAAVRSHCYGQSTVYTETNQTSGNQVLAYRAASGGALTPLAAYSTGGLGTGASPNSQGGVTLGDGGRVLAVVNGGSDTVSVFGVGHGGYLWPIATGPSGGTDPISVTIDGSWIYALNAGTTTVAPNIGGFNLFATSWTRIQSLGTSASSPEQVSATPNGRDLVVTEKGSNTIDVFPLGWHGWIGAPVTTTLASGTGPYGFSFSNSGDLVVSEAAFGGLATFSLNWNGTLTQISQVADGQMAPCWTALANNGHEVFTTNAHSGNISAYWIGWNGVLTLISPSVQASTATVGDTDIAVAGNGTLYTSVQPLFQAAPVLAGGDLGSITTVISGDATGTFGLAATP